MIEGIAENVVRIVLLVGLPLLVVLFYLDGIVVGKILQPGIVFIAVIAVARPTWWILALTCLACILAVVAGQWTLFRSVDDRTSLHVDDPLEIPVADGLSVRIVERVGERPLRFVEHVFVRFGGLAIVLSTFLPVIRGVIAIPAGVSSYAARRFVLATVVGNTLYFLALVAVAFGILELTGHG